MRCNDREAENKGNRSLLEPEQHRRMFFHGSILIPEKQRETASQHDGKQPEAGEEIHLPGLCEKPNPVANGKRQRDEKRIQWSDVPELRLRPTRFLAQITERQNRNENIDENVR